MTSTVHIQAHCGDEKEVFIYVDGYTPESYVVQDGDEQTLYAYDDRVIRVGEREKGTSQIHGKKLSGVDMSDDWRIQWRMDLIVRHANESGLTLEKAAEAFVKAQAVLTTTQE